jgi:hypothetical protein
LGNIEPRIRLITRRHSPSPSSATRSAIGSPYGVPTSEEECYGLTVFRVRDNDGLGALCSPVAMVSMPEEPSNLWTRLQSRFWVKPISIFGLLHSDDVYREFTCVHHTIDPSPLPPDAGSDTLASRFGYCPVGHGSIVRGLLTARCLAAVPRRVLLMEQQVW